MKKLLCVWEISAAILRNRLKLHISNYQHIQKSKGCTRKSATASGGGGNALIRITEMPDKRGKTCPQHRQHVANTHGNIYQVQTAIQIWLTFWWHAVFVGAAGQASMVRIQPRDMSRAITTRGRTLAFFFLSPWVCKQRQLLAYPVTGTVSKSH